MLIGAIRAGEGGRTRDIVMFAGFGATGIFTLPVFVLVFLAQGAVLLALPALRRRALVAMLGVGVASLVVYAPLLDDLRNNADQEFGVRLRWYGWLTRPYSDLASPTLRSLAPNRPEWLGGTLIIAGLCAVLVILAVFRCVRRDENVLLWSLVVPIIGTYVALVVFRFYVEPRFVSFLLFHVIVLLALGLTELWTLVRTVRLLRPVAALVVVLVVGFGIHNAIVDTRARAEKPLEDYRLVGQIVKGSGVAQVFTNSLRPQGFDYYVGRGRYMRMGGRYRAEAIFCDESRSLIYVDHNLNDTPDQDVSCLLRRGATRIHIEQRVGSFDVWIAVVAGDATR
jgi:hypothetical protein